MEKNVILSRMYGYLERIMTASGVAIPTTALEHSVYNQGNRAAIVKVLRKALRGEEINLCAFGGSITRGACSTQDPSKESGISHSLREMNYFDYILRFRDEFRLVLHTPHHFVVGRNMEMSTMPSY